jgi:N-acetylmuramoyl-L-alanine amidase
MPSVRTEIGFATNPNDAALLADHNVRDQIAGHLASAISRLFTPRIG